MEEIRSGSKDKSLKNKLPKGDIGGTTAKLFRVVSYNSRRESILLLPSSYKPYSTSFHFLKQTFLYTFLRQTSQVNAVC